MCIEMYGRLNQSHCINTRERSSCDWLEHKTEIESCRDAHSLDWISLIDSTRTMSYLDHQEMFPISNGSPWSEINDEINNERIDEE